MSVRSRPTRMRRKRGTRGTSLLHRYLPVGALRRNVGWFLFNKLRNGIYSYGVRKLLGPRSPFR